MSFTNLLIKEEREMVKTSSIKEPYFSHDYSTRMKKEIKKLIRDMGFEGYGLYWAVVEFMFRNELKVGEEDLVLDSSEFTDKIKSILNDYGLFRTENDYYISDRIIETIELQEEKTKKAADSASSRWIISDFAKEYEKVFGIRPELGDDEIKAIKSFNKKITDFKQKLPAVFSVLSKIKFDTKIGFVPRVDWLLKENHLREILNGQYGELKVDTSKNEREKLIKARNRFQEKIDNFDIGEFSTKSEAIDFIITDNIDRVLPNCCHELMEKFDITHKELASAWEVQYENK